MVWYAEELRFDGEWAPVLYHGPRPSQKTTSGTRRRLRNVREVPPELLGMTLIQLCQHFNQQGATHENDH